MAQKFFGLFFQKRTAFFLPLLLSSCQQPPADLQPVTFTQVPGWSTDALTQTLPALRAGCQRLALLPAETVLGGSGLAAAAGGRAGQWAGPCTAARALVPGDAAAARHFYESWFQPYRIGAAAVVTGYYEPEVRGARSPDATYDIPVLARPDDLRQGPAAPDGSNGKPVVGRLQDGRLVPYWTRAEIEAGRARGAMRPLLWLADPIDLFFLQVQGSGRVRLPDGRMVRLGYDGKNGRPYTPIGRVLIAQGAMVPQDVTMQSIRAWMVAHPAQAQAVMDRNEDYVFFRVLPDAADAVGPPGALGVNLVAGRTAAVDRHAIPLAAPIFVDTTDPLTGKPWQRLLLAQDMGTDIVGPARVDVFLGAGEAAAQGAGRMRQPGTDYLLLPRPAS